MAGDTPCRVLRVASVESVPLFEFGLRSTVDKTPALCWAGSCKTATGAIELCEFDHPDVLLIGSWVDPQWKLCQMLTSMFRGLAVVSMVATTARNSALAATARSHGARGMLSADATSEHLVAAIRVASCGYYVDPSLGITAMPVARADGTGQRPLTRREFEVLHFIADGRTAEYIGKRLGITGDTVRTHIGHILRKLGARDRAHAVAQAFQTSLLSTPTAAEAAASADDSSTAPADASSRCGVAGY
jgi:DNA-binding NarL/FixJ family response regulator